MKWLDPEGLRALYGQSPEGEAVSVEEADKKARKKAEKELKKTEKSEKKKAKKAAKKAEKKAEKAEKKALKHSEKSAQKDVLAAAGISLSKYDKCCKKFRKGKQCRDCPLGEKAKLLLPTH